MKYVIVINQKSAFDSFGNQLDFSDLAIYDFIKSLIVSKKAITMQYQGEMYIQLRRTYIIDQMPLLGIKTKEGISKRLNNLCVVGILKRYEHNQSENQSYYCIGDKAKLLEFDSEKSNPLSKEVNSPMNESSHPPMNESSHNNIYNTNNDIIDKVISNTAKAVSDGTQEFEVIWKLYNANANARTGTKHTSYKKWLSLYKDKSFRLMFEQSLLQQKIVDYLLDCHLSNRSNKHFSTYLNSREWESYYLCESFKGIEIQAGQAKKLSDLFNEIDIIKIKWFLSYITASQLYDKFKGSVNDYLNKINDSSAFKMSFSRFAGTYAKSYKDGEWLNYIKQ